MIALCNFQNLKCVTFESSQRLVDVFWLAFYLLLTSNSNTGIKSWTLLFNSLVQCEASSDDCSCLVIEGLVCFRIENLRSLLHSVAKSHVVRLIVHSIFKASTSFWCQYRSLLPVCGKCSLEWATKVRLLPVNSYAYQCSSSFRGQQLELLPKFLSFALISWDQNNK